MKEKTKRLTKKDQEQDLIKWVEEFKENALKTYTGFDNIHAQNFVSNNTNMLRCYCTACGHEWDIVKTAHYPSKLCCPHCHAEGKGNLSPVITHMENHDNGWYVIRYQFEQQTNNHDNDDVFAWMKAPANYRIMAYTAMRYEQDNDVVMYVDSQENCYRWYAHARIAKTYRRGSADFNAAVEQYQKECRKQADTIPIADAIDNALTSISELKAEAKAKRAPSKADVIVAEQQRYQAKEDGLERAREAFVAFPMVVVSQYGKNSKYAIMCSHCGHQMTINATSPQEALSTFAGDNRTCPHCGEQAVETSLYSYYTKIPVNAKIFLYESTNLPDEDLLLRIFTAKAELSMVPGINGKYTTEMVVDVQEDTRFFFGTKIAMFTWDTTKGTWVKERSELRDYTNRSWHHSSEVCANTNEELLEIIKNSRLRYSGLKEAIGSDKRYRCIASPTNLSYVALWYQNPAIEHVYKSQLYTLTNELISGRTRSDFTLAKGDDVYTALGCTPMELKIARKCDLGSYDFEHMKRYCANDPTITPDGYKALADKVHMTNAAEIASFGIRWKEIIEYVDTVLLHQCIAPNETMGVWVDYLRMASEIGYNLRERSRRFPSSLRKEHDIAVFAHRSIKKAIDAKKFAENAQKNAEKYDYSFEDLFVMVPRTVEQVVEEATNQHNCLATYVNRLISGDTCVAFIRYKETPDSSYVTCEIRDGALVQIKGFSNSNPRTSELSKFIDKWCKAKKLVVRHW